MAAVLNWRTISLIAAGEVDFSHRIIEAHGEAAAEGKGVAVVDGRLIENLHVENAKRLVSLADAIEALDGAPA